MLCLENAALNVDTETSLGQLQVPVLLREVYQQQALMQQALVSAQAMSAEHKHDDYSDIHNFGKFI